MDPITLEKLLSVCNSIEDSRTSDVLSNQEFNRIIQDNFQSKLILRRTRDVLRILEALSWLSSTRTNGIKVNQSFDVFIDAWNKADILIMNHCLEAYTPYKQFLRCLKKQGIFDDIPPRGEKEAEKRFGKLLNERYSKDVYGTLNFTIFETFRFWATTLGQAYLSPLDESLSWGGEWNDNLPSIDYFEFTLSDIYHASDQSSGYANIIQIADTICHRLKISLQAFEVKLSVLAKRYPKTLILAPLTARRTNSRITIALVRPRLYVVQEKIRATLMRKKQQSNIRWLTTRYVEDGVQVNGRMVKLIKLEKQHDKKSRPETVQASGT